MLDPLSPLTPSAVHGKPSVVSPLVFDPDVSIRALVRQLPALLEGTPVGRLHRMLCTARRSSDPKRSTNQSDPDSKLFFMHLPPRSFSGCPPASGRRRTRWTLRRLAVHISEWLVTLYNSWELDHVQSLRLCDLPAYSHSPHQLLAFEHLVEADRIALPSAVGRISPQQYLPSDLCRYFEA